ncbi:MAG: alanine racemase [Eubacterium sp.]|nr:alanine racemase [Eubacterium sp.]
MNSYLRTYAEVSLSAIHHNVEEAKKRILPGTKLLAVVKANAYGHGAVRVAKSLEDIADFFAVATLEEGVELREHNIGLPILILGYTSPQQYSEMINWDIRPSIYNAEDARKLNETAIREGKTARVHIALDTGMTRIGFQVTEADADAIQEIASLSNVEIEGMFTHLSCADMTDKTYCGKQFEKYDAMLAMLQKRNVRIPIRHVCNSAAIMEYEADDPHRFDMVRSGIITYGIYPSEEVKKERLDLIPALSWKAHVIHVKDVGPGIGVSYGATYVTSRPVTRIATVSVGYADGYPRALSSKGRVLIHGKSAPILGRVCMDQMMVDVSDIPDVQVEDVVTLVGHDGEEYIPIEEIADPAASFNYEMLCHISPRVYRVYKEDQD